MNEVISVDPDVCDGKPVFRGTRIAVWTVFEFLSTADSVEDVLAHYPRHRGRVRLRLPPGGQPSQRGTGVVVNGILIDENLPTGEDAMDDARKRWRQMTMTPSCAA